MKKEIIEGLQNILTPEQIFIEEPMKKHTTFRIGGPAEVFLRPDESQVADVITFLKGNQVPVLVIGNGSNLLVGDKGIKGAVVEIGRSMDHVNVLGEVLTVSAGALLSKAANAALKAGLTGMEFASGIPGTVGGAVVMNAGAYGGEIRDIIEWAEVIDSQGKVLRLTKEELQLSYRHSCILEQDYIVIKASFRLKSGVEEEISAMMKDFNGRRREKQPLEYPSAGSTFKRPEGYFAGKLIMDSGLAGYQVGGAQVSEKHCGFVINTGNATAQDVHDLIKYVQDKVYEEFQVHIEPEVKFAGEF